MKRIFYHLLTIAFITLLFLIFLEVVLRLALNAPKGIFSGFFITEKGLLYPENLKFKIEMGWGPIPYTVEVNSLGFRGDEFAFHKPKDKIRIFAIGDSVTDGFFVDNNATYPYFLQSILNKKYGWNAEVINAARGGGSIDKEYAILQQRGLPLDPDITILTFVPNDISEIRGKPKQDLISIEKQYFGLRRTFTQWFLTKTAIGEFSFDVYLKMRSKIYRVSKARLKTGSTRYKIEGGNNYLENAKLFDQRFFNDDGLILKEPFSSEVDNLIDNYLFALNKMKELCTEHRITLLFVYYPTYSQVYDTKSSKRIQDILSNACSRLSIPFLDLTQTFRKYGKDKVLHLAPIDFHLNPEGNEVMAYAIAEYLSNHLIQTES
jgi:lysophospholipase L1-like esterase